MMEEDFIEYFMGDGDVTTKLGVLKNIRLVEGTVFFFLICSWHFLGLKAVLLPIVFLFSMADRVSGSKAHINRCEFQSP